MRRRQDVSCLLAVKIGSKSQMDKYEAYEKYQQFDETEYERGSASRYAKRKPARKKPSPATVRAQLSDFDDNVAAWVPSYAAALDPLHHERQWLIDSVGPFYLSLIHI